MSEDPVVKELIKSLGAEAVLLANTVTDRYYHIWEMEVPLEAKAVVLPRTTKDVSHICQICHKYNQSIVVHGGLTGLVGSTKSHGNEVVVSMEKLNRIEEVDQISRTATVEAGVVLEHLQNAAKENGLLFPLNFGAKGSAQIGGCIASNAGGLRVIKYGMTRNLILGLEAVMANGSVISSMKKIIKDNSGYDLKQLFIGSEGTLGIVTRALLKLKELPSSRNSAFIGFNDFDKIIHFLKSADKKLAGALSGFEILWRDTYQQLTSEVARQKAPLPSDYDYYILMESLGGDTKQDKENLETLLQEATQDQIILDAVISHSDSDCDWFWSIRENVDVLNTTAKYQQSFDISLPIGDIDSYVKQVKEALLAQLNLDICYAFGHLGDGNIHFVVGKETNDNQLKEQINKIVYAPLKDLQGSVSAEHGIGIDKKKWLSISRSQEEIALMKTLKHALDPKGILNPGRVID